MSWGGLIANVAAKIKAATLNVTDTELKVLEATNEEAWGPHGTAMSEIARLAEDPEKYSEILGILHQRLQERDENWRLCYKALLVLEFLCKQGPMRIVSDLQRSIHMIERLRDMFEYKDANGRDQGINVRARAKELVMLLNDSNKLQQEREKAAKNSGKYKGVSNDDMRRGVTSFGGGGYSSGSGFGSSSYGSGSGGYGGSGSGGYGGSGGFGSGGNYSRDSTSQSQYDSTGPSYSGVGSSGNKHGSSSASKLDHTPTNGDGGDWEDPFEATRKRIEKLKQEGALPDPPKDLPITGPTGVFMDTPNAEPKKVPKKLKDVKINPQFANTFASLAQQTGPGSGSFQAGTPGSSTPTSAAPSASASNNTLDLLGDLAGPRTTPASAAQPGLVPPPPPPGRSVGAAAPLIPPPPAKSAAAPLAVAAPPPPPAASKPADPFDLLGFDDVQSTTAPAAAPSLPAVPAFTPAPAAPTAFPAMAPPPAAAPPPLPDLFASFPAAAPAPATDLFAGMPAAAAAPRPPPMSMPAAPAPASDPFAALAAAPVSAKPPQQAAPAPASDAFFDFSAAPSAPSSSMAAAPAPAAGFGFDDLVAARPASSNPTGGFPMPPPPASGAMKPSAAAPPPPPKSRDPFADLI
mmetsp:Transcript_31014/g.68811  ORF Transcript_31014/g.68811 Transcript_31014/m.68811 type:complete len:633 (+) Transcript_31014:139-2037(+)